jgi:translation initiation factor 1 (eIF-1/SUI1)
MKKKIIQLQGDFRDEIKEFLIYEGIGIEKTIKIHGL